MPTNILCYSYIISLIINYRFILLLFRFSSLSLLVNSNSDHCHYCYNNRQQNDRRIKNHHQLSSSISSWLLSPSVPNNWNYNHNTKRIIRRNVYNMNHDPLLLLLQQQYSMIRSTNHDSFCFVVQFGDHRRHFQKRSRLDHEIISTTEKYYYVKQSSSRIIMITNTKMKSLMMTNDDEHNIVKQKRINEQHNGIEQHIKQKIIGKNAVSKSTTQRNNVTNVTSSNKRIKQQDSKIQQHNIHNKKQHHDTTTTTTTTTTIPKITPTTVTTPTASTTMRQKQQQRRQVSFLLPKPTIQIQLQYSRNGHAVLRQLLTNDIISSSSIINDLIDIHQLRTILYQYGQTKQLYAWQQKVQVALEKTKQHNNQLLPKTINECYHILKQYDVPVHNLPFLQYFHCWKDIPVVYQLCQLLAEYATILMDVSSVRLYQDSLFWKRCNSNTNTNNNNNNKKRLDNNNNVIMDGPTPWHTDAKMAPFDTNSIITFWIPLQTIPKYSSGLIFCSKSHNDFALPYWNSNNNDNDNDNNSPWNNLESRYQQGNDGNSHKQKDSIHIDYMPLNVGDVTVHSGWTLHCADPCLPIETIDRLALAITFVDSRAPIRKDAQQTVLLRQQQQQQQKGRDSRADENVNNNKNNKADREDLWSYQDWITEVPCDSYDWDHPLVPIMWPPPKKRKKKE